MTNSNFQPSCKPSYADLIYAKFDRGEYQDFERAIVFLQSALSYEDKRSERIERCRQALIIYILAVQSNTATVEIIETLKKARLVEFAEALESNDYSSLAHSLHR